MWKSFYLKERAKKGGIFNVQIKPDMMFLVVKHVHGLLHAHPFAYPTIHQRTHLMSFPLFLASENMPSAALFSKSSICPVSQEKTATTPMFRLGTITSNIRWHSMEFVEMCWGSKNILSGTLHWNFRKMIVMITKSWILTGEAYPSCHKMFTSLTLI